MTGDEGGDARSGEGGDGASSPQALVCKTGNQSTTCQPGESCCIVGGFAPSATCQSSGPCSGTTIHCGKTADCPSDQICCGTEMLGAFGSTSYTDVSCASTCPAGSTLMPKYQFCDMAGNDCPSGKTCTQSTILASYAVCR